MPARMRRALGPKGALIATVLAYAFFAIFAVATVVAHAAAVQSSYVQSHGVRDTATVVSEDDIAHTSKHSTTYTSLVTVQLQQPVNGTTSSVVHVPYAASDFAGYKMTVLVDPRDPGYSELPGSANTTNASWIEMLVFAVVVLVIAVLLTRRTIRLFAQRRGAGAPGFINYASR